jgi:hypothetical protein
VLREVTKKMSENKPMEDWLETWYTKESVKTLQKARFEVFVDWTKKTPKQLVEEFEQKKARDLLLKFQNYLKNDVVVRKGARKGEKGLLDNSVRNYVNTVRAFYSSQCETVKGLKKKIISGKKAKGEHVFSLSDLQKVWHIADTRDKAIIAVGASLGWDASAFLEMDRDYFEGLIKRARDQEEEFIRFEWQRPKTGAEQYGVLTPCAIDSLERWLQHPDSKKKKGLWNGLTQDGLNKVLKRLVREAAITTTGRIRWHLLRKWLMNTLSRNGLNTWEVKVVLGKTIPTTDLTYLQKIKEDAFEKYKTAYPMNMSLVSYSNNNLRQESIQDMIGTLARALMGLIQEQRAKEARGLQPIEVTKAYTTEEAEDILEELKRILASLEKP